MLRRRRQLRVFVFLLCGFVSLNYLAPLFMPVENDVDLWTPALDTPATVSEFRHTIVKSKITTQVKSSKTGEGVTQKDSLCSNGFNQSRRAKKICKGPKRLPGYIVRWKQLRLHALFETEERSLQLCPVWKAGTTFIRRLFAMKNKEEYKSYINPFNISFFENYTTSSQVIYKSEKIKRFLFVRNPYSRVLSCYIDKLLAPNPFYWNAIGTRGIYLFRSKTTKLSRTCGHDITFLEFVKYVIAALGYRTPGAQTDPHFIPVYQLCQPCAVLYDFIGKIETFKNDYPVLVKELNLTHTDDILSLLEREGDELTAIDAIEDTIESALNPEFVHQLNACISFSEVLQRTWWKLQLRGLVSPHPPAISFNNVQNMTVKELVELAKESRRKSNTTERKAYQHRQFVEFYSQIPKTVLEQLRVSYLYDFTLFEYDQRPKELFGNH